MRRLCRAARVYRMAARLMFVFAVFGVSSLLTSCDPCAGVMACGVAARVAVQGRIVDMSEGHAARARVSLIRVSEDRHDSVSTLTDEQGNYSLSLTSGAGTFDVQVEPIGLPSYRVRNLQLPSSTRLGEAYVLGLWGATPLLASTIELVDRKTDQAVLNGTVSFHRTGGPPISGANLVNDTYTASLDGTGHVRLFDGVQVGGADDVIGDLTLTTPDAATPSVVHDVHVPPIYAFRPVVPQSLRLYLGTALTWVGQIYDRSVVVGVPGTKITFQRTSGIAVVPETLTTTTNEKGFFTIELSTKETGTVTGNIVIDPPPPFDGYTKTNIQMYTFDSDVAKFFPAWGVGPHLPWLGVVRCAGKPLYDVQVTATRVSGVTVLQQSLSSNSDLNGIFNLIFKPLEYGSLVVDIQFTPPSKSGCAPYVVHGVVLQTLDYDSDARYMPPWDLPPR